MREPRDSDRVLTDVARAALFEITDAETVGAVTGIDEDTPDLVTVFFASTMPGYPGWRWTVALSTLDGVDVPSVLETELTPGEGALLAPDWVPWADRLAEYRAAGHDTSELDAAEADDESDLDDDDSDDGDADELDSDDEDSDAEDDEHDDEHDDADDSDLLDPFDDIDGVDFEVIDDSEGDGDASGNQGERAEKDDSEEE